MARKSKKNSINRKESKIMLAMTGVLLAVAGTVFVLTGQLSTLNIMGNSTSGGYYSCPGKSTDSNGITYEYSKKSASTCYRYQYYVAPKKCPSYAEEVNGSCLYRTCSTGYQEYNSDVCYRKTGNKLTCPKGYKEVKKGVKTSKPCVKTVLKPYCEDKAMKLLTDTQGNYYCKKGKYICSDPSYEPKQIPGKDKWGCYAKETNYLCELGTYSADIYKVRRTGSGKNTKCYLEKKSSITCPDNVKATKDGECKILKSKKCPSSKWKTVKIGKKEYCTTTEYKINYTSVKEIKPRVTTNEKFMTYAKYDYKMAAVKYYNKDFYANKKSEATYDYKAKIKKTVSKETYCNAPYSKQRYSGVDYCEYQDVINATYHPGSGSNSPKIACNLCYNMKNTAAQQSCLKNCDKNRNKN